MKNPALRRGFLYGQRLNVSGLGLHRRIAPYLRLSLIGFRPFAGPMSRGEDFSGSSLSQMLSRDLVRKLLPDHAAMPPNRSPCTGLAMPFSASSKRRSRAACAFDAAVKMARLSFFWGK